MVCVALERITNAKMERGVAKFKFVYPLLASAPPRVAQLNAPIEPQNKKAKIEPGTNAGI